MRKSKQKVVMGLVISAIAAIVWAQPSTEVLLLDQPADDDVYAAQREVKLLSSVNGDFVAAGQRITVDGDVTGDVIAAAQEVEILSNVSDDVRAAGQAVRVTSPVSGHVVAAGQTVVISEDVGDWAWLAGESVDVLGDVGGDLKIVASTITINAEVAGDVELIGNSLDLGPSAIVRGDLTWRSDSDPDINPEAQIDGVLIEEPLPDAVEELSGGRKYILSINIIIAATVLILLFSRPLQATAKRVTTSPGRALLLGLSIFIVTPVVAVFLLFSGVGVWLGLALLFIYFVLILLGVLTGLYSVSDLALRRFRPHPAMWHSLAAVVVTIVAVGLIARIPWVGFLTVTAIWFLGLGALCWSAWATLQSARSMKIR